MSKKLRGGSGSSWVSKGDYLYNDTPEDYEIHYSYSTVANGSSDRIVLKPGGLARKLTNGSSYDFTLWEIWEAEERPTACCMFVSFVKSH